MKRIFYLIIPLLFLFVVGCDAKLDVVIKDKNVTISNKFIIDKSQVDDSIYYTIDRMAGKYFLSADFLLGDSKEYYDGDKAIYMKKEKFSLKEFERSNIFSFCYDAHNVILEDNYILITTSNNFKCYDIYKELDNFDIVLKTNHKLIETNADEIDGYIYKWHVSKSNANNKPISIKLYKDKYVFNYEHEFTIKVAIIALVILTILITAFIIRRRVKKAGEV